ncbi:hypothetical protein NOZE110980_16575 [Nocardioides zeicaulis]
MVPTTETSFQTATRRGSLTYAHQILSRGYLICPRKWVRMATDVR